MPEIALFLGPVVFADFEIPESINFGGTQRLAIHRLAGGGRVIDSLGRDDADIRFAGTFSGSDATARARVLDELRVAGTSLSLSWDVLYYTVVIQRFEADYRNGWWIPFRITCSVLRDEASSPNLTIGSLADDVTSDLAVAIAQAYSAGIDISGAEVAISAPDAVIRNSSGFINAQNVLSNSSLSISQQAQTAGNNLAGVNFDAASSADDGITDLSTAVNATQQLASLSAANAYLGRAIINLGNAGT